MAETKAKQSDMFKNLMTTLMALRSSADEAITTLAGIKDKTAETYADLDSAAQTAVEGVGEPIDQFQQIISEAYPEEQGEDEDIELDIVRPDGSDEQLAVKRVPATTADEDDEVDESDAADEDDAMHTVESEQMVEQEEEEDIVEINTTHLESSKPKKRMLDTEPEDDEEEEEVHADFEKDPKTGQFAKTGGGAGGGGFALNMGIGMPSKKQYSQMKAVNIEASDKRSGSKRQLRISASSGSTRKAYEAFSSDVSAAVRRLRKSHDTVQIRQILNK